MLHVDLSVVSEYHSSRWFSLKSTKLTLYKMFLHERKFPNHRIQPSDLHDIIYFSWDTQMDGRWITILLSKINNECFNFNKFLKLIWKVSNI